MKTTVVHSSAREIPFFSLRDLRPVYLLMHVVFKWPLINVRFDSIPVTSNLFRDHVLVVQRNHLSWRKSYNFTKCSLPSNTLSRKLKRKYQYIPEYIGNITLLVNTAVENMQSTCIKPQICRNTRENDRSTTNSAKKVAHYVFNMNQTFKKGKNCCSKSSSQHFSHVAVVHLTLKRPVNNVCCDSNLST